jgi:hypothetical protein
MYTKHMGRLVLSISFILLFIVACNSWSFPPKCDDCGFVCLQEGEINVFTNNCPLGFTCEYNVYPNSKVDLSEPSGVGKGRNTVFEMITYTEAVANNTNDDIRKTMIFEIPADQRTFYVAPEGLTKTKAHLKTECLCLTTDFVSGELGCIAGEMQFDGVWFVYGKVSFSYPYGTEEMKFEARFDEVKKIQID